IPTDVHKRLVEQKEKLLESSVWSTEDLYEILASLKGHREGDMGRYRQVLRLLCVTFHTDITLLGKTSMSMEVAGFQYFTSFIRDMVATRLRPLLNSLHRRSDETEAVYQSALSYVGDLLNAETELRLLTDRHLDAVVLSSAYAACALGGLTGVRLPDLVTAYKAQPQFDYSNICDIRLAAPGEKGSITQFFNIVYRNALDHVIGSSNRQCGLREAEECPIELFSPMRRNQTGAQQLQRQHQAQKPRK
ncbi:hypothetical protein HK405_011586, partial [Cladochytrium tenue]